jgi:hypothetical protein
MIQHPAASSDTALTTSVTGTITRKPVPLRGVLDGRCAGGAVGFEDAELVAFGSESTTHD